MCPQAYQALIWRLHVRMMCTGPEIDMGCQSQQAFLHHALTSTHLGACARDHSHPEASQEYPAQIQLTDIRGPEITGCLK